MGSKLFRRTLAGMVPVLFLSFDANAWIDKWAPAFKSTPADVRALSGTSVSNYVCSAQEEFMACCEYCRGYSLDLNDDGIEDQAFIIPWMGVGLNAVGYDVHFVVSDGAKGWKTSVIGGYGVEKSDFVRVAGKTYFRHSTVFGQFEKSDHNHWVYQVFSFDKNGTMRCSNGDFGKQFPAVTIFYINPKFKQIELTKGDLKKIENETRRIISQKRQSAIVANKGFDLLNYRYLWNDDAEKARMVVNPASKKKEADDWKPRRKLTETECAKLMRIMTDRFGEPAKCRNGYASFVYVWRFEGDEWLSVGVSTMANMGGDPIAINHWDWRKPELSVYDEEEVKAREYPIVQIDKEGLPPAAFFEFFDPYSGFKEGETDCNLVTEFNATKYLGLADPRCTAEWDAVERRYEIWTKDPDKRRGEITCKSGGDGEHADECHVGIVQFYKLAPDLFMCYSMFCVNGTIGADIARYLFEVYDRDIWSVELDKPVKSKMVRYLGTFSIDDVPRYREKRIRAQ